jgi:excisionase family DNA binding protein
MERLLLPVEEFARMCDLSRSAAYKLVKEGRIRTVRVTPRGAVRVPVEAVQEFVDSLDSSPSNPAA